MLEKGAIPRFEFIEINEASSVAFYTLNVPSENKNKGVPPGMALP